MRSKPELLATTNRSGSCVECFMRIILSAVRQAGNQSDSFNVRKLVVNATDTGSTSPTRLRRCRSDGLSNCIFPRGRHRYWCRCWTPTRRWLADGTVTETWIPRSASNNKHQATSFEWQPSTFSFAGLYLSGLKYVVGLASQTLLHSMLMMQHFLATGTPIVRTHHITVLARFNAPIIVQNWWVVCTKMIIINLVGSLFDTSCRHIGQGVANANVT